MFIPNLSVQNEQFIILSLLFLQIPTHPASQNMRVGSKPGKTHFNSCISVYSLNVCPLPYTLRTYHNSVNKTMRKRRCKECIPNANRVQAKECFLKTKNGFKQKVKNQSNTSKVFLCSKALQDFSPLPTNQCTNPLQLLFL